MVGLDSLRGFFQPKQFYNSLLKRREGEESKMAEELPFKLQVGFGHEQFTLIQK